MSDREDEGTEHLVLINGEEQYSLWRADIPVPEGWRETGKRGPREDCLSYVREVWTDMRPLSLRRRMDASPADEAGAPALSK